MPPTREEELLIDFGHDHRRCQRNTIKARSEDSARPDEPLVNGNVVSDYSCLGKKMSLLLLGRFVAARRMETEGAS